MKRVLVALLVLPAWILGQSVSFDAFFVDQTMRIDYYHTGDAADEVIALDQIYEEGLWASSLTNLIDPFLNGGYTFKVYDVATNRLIYSYGFDSYFEEYQTTDPAIAGVERTYHETALIPYPRRPVRFVVEKRDREHLLHPIFMREIDPASIAVIREGRPEEARILEVQRSGDPHRCVDLVWIAEGYTEGEVSVFQSDVEHLREVLFRTDPYRKHRKKFNIYGVFMPSQDSGVDEPRRGVYKRTAADASFNALNLERYLLTENNRAYRDLAAHVPYDALFILANSDRYGGGGIYRSFGISTTHDARSDGVCLHEFGHSFAGLADEYFSSEVAYNEFYPPGIEPLEPNITALLDPEHVKWADLLSPGIAIPTDWGKERIEALEAERAGLHEEMRERMEALEKDGASGEALSGVRESIQGKFDDLRERLNNVEAEYEHLNGKVGVFEGAGYSSTGLYRSEIDCLMKSTSRDSFCRVCRAAIERMILFYTE